MGAIPKLRVWPCGHGADHPPARTTHFCVCGRHKASGLTDEQIRKNSSRLSELIEEYKKVA